jgi:CutA1 divalent ion tolerance protein
LTVQVLGFADRREGEVQTEQEWRVEIKTAADRIAALAEQIKANHSYDVPEIIATPITRWQRRVPVLAGGRDARLRQSV